MLELSKSRPVEQRTLPASDEYISPAQLYDVTIGFLHRQFYLIGFVLLLILALGVVYILSTPPLYTSRAVLVIDSHRTPLFQSETPNASLPINSTAVDTQIEVLNSDNIALSVIEQLHLNQDPEFISPSDGVFGSLVGLVTGAANSVTSLFSASTTGEPSSDELLMQRTLRTFQSHLKIKRVALTFAIEIYFESLSPDRAAQITNAVADAYVVNSLETKFQTTKRASVWLQDRLKELREESSIAERAVVDYKAKNNIIDTGGRLMNEQQLAEYNSELIQARAQTAEAKARFERVQQVLVAGDVDPVAATTATVADTLHNEVISKLRSQYLEYDARASDWAQKYGPNHLAVVNLRNQMGELRRTISEELRRTAQTYQSDYEIAKQREISVQRSLDQIVSDSQITNEAAITLHNLDSSAQTYRALYDNFLQRYMESVQQQSFPISDSRLITRAKRPLYKSSPKSFLVLALASLVGLILGSGLAIMRDISDRVFRTTAQIGEYLQADCLSLVPLAKPTLDASAQQPKPTEPVGPRTIVRDASVRWTVVNSPLSRYTESIRAIKVALDISSKSRQIIGVTSSLPNEGKSTIALALTELIAHGGGKAILVDCDLRNPSLSRALAPNATVGLLDVISGKATLEDALWTEPTTGLAFLPTVVESRFYRAAEILASDATRILLNRLRKTYDYVIVDLSPLAPVVDVRVVAPLMNTFLFVIEWGNTKIDVVEHALSNARGVYDNLLGVVLNKADMSTFGRYDINRGGYYYNSHYARYGYTD